MISLIIAFFSIIILAVLHELGHFLIAKKCGVKIEEFGIGYPPRIFGKKFGETLYSLNLLPFGAFVKMEGEDKNIDSSTSFSKQSILNRVLITSGGVMSFWLIAIIIFSIVFSLGTSVMIDDNAKVNPDNVDVRIVQVVKSSPADNAGIKSGDIIKSMSYNNEYIYPSKVRDVQSFTLNHAGEDIGIIVDRKGEKIQFPVNVRLSYPKNEGAIGVALVRTAIEQYPWYSSIYYGIIRTWNATVMVLEGYGMMIVNLFHRTAVAGGLVGPIGVFQMIAQSETFGIAYFLSFLAMISINLAVFNSLPIPLVDGGRVLFLMIEWMRKKPISEKIQEKIDSIAFAFLGGLIIWVMVRDIINLF